MNGALRRPCGWRTLLAPGSAGARFSPGIHARVRPSTTGATEGRRYQHWPQRPRARARLGRDGAAVVVATRRRCRRERGLKCRGQRRRRGRCRRRRSRGGGGGRRAWRDRRHLARIADAVAVAVVLRRVRDPRAVVERIGEFVAVRVGRGGDDQSRRFARADEHVTAARGAQRVDQTLDLLRRVRAACGRRTRRIATAVPLPDLRPLPGLSLLGWQKPSSPQAFTGAVGSQGVPSSRTQPPGGRKHCPPGPQSAATTQGAPLVVQTPVLTAPTVMMVDAGTAAAPPLRMRRGSARSRVHR